MAGKETKKIEIAFNSRYKKNKESAHMACMDKLISQHSLEISPILIPLIKNEINSIQGKSHL